MPKERKVEERRDFSGGMHTRQSKDQLGPEALVEATNVRISERHGGLVKRLGSRRLHGTAIAAAGDVLGVQQWDQGSATNQLVATGDGDLFHKTSDYGEFTQVSPGTALSTSKNLWGTMRTTSSGAALRLYFTDGVRFWRWSGSALTDVTAAGGAPLNVDFFKPYHLRAFWHDTDFENHISWSVLGDPEDDSTGDETQGGATMVDVQRGEGLVAFETIGSSLLIASPESIARFTGYSDRDIQIAQDVEGISSEVGCVGPLALRRIERFALMAATEGIFAITETEATSVSDKIEDQWDALDRSTLSLANIGYHKGRREAWVAVPGVGESVPKTVFVLSLGAVNGWVKFTFPFGILNMASWEDSSGAERIIAGCDDGFVRVLDEGTSDDATAAGAAGTIVTMQAQLAPFFFGDISEQKTLERVFLDADIASGTELEVHYRFDAQSWRSLAIAGVGGGIQPYRLDAYGQGRRLDLRLVSRDAGTPKVTAVRPIAFAMSRWT